MDKKYVGKLLEYFANSEERATIYNKCMIKLDKDFGITSAVLCMLAAYFVCEFTEGSEQARWRDGK